MPEKRQASPATQETPEPAHHPWQGAWRERIWSQLSQPWDVVIIGGGITGAGILREATRAGLKALLVEQRDFAWGTSSRSSKLVHGGLRYLKEGKLGLTLASVQERQSLLEEAPGLIDPLGFLLATHEGDRTSRILYAAGLGVYDLLALQWSHRYYSAQDFRMMVPHLTPQGLKGGFRFGDAQTDDARLVLRILREAVIDGGTAINYVAARELIRGGNGRVSGITLSDRIEGWAADVYANTIINATGAWADRLREQLGAKGRIRPLRGSHLIFPRWRLPTPQAFSFLHPLDHRPIFIFPWESITLVGTTDVDHLAPLDEEPAISAEEVAYLMAAVEAQFPSLAITLDDVIATFAGVRPVIGSGKPDPSDESRDHVVWEEDRLLTVTGGKLTTFRIIAHDVLKAAGAAWTEDIEIDSDAPLFRPVATDLPETTPLDDKTQRRLLGRYGNDAAALVAAAQPGEMMDTIPGTKILWAELRWAARAEAVVHLEDLLLRRVRLGLLLEEGGRALLPQIRATCQHELGWDDGRWRAEEEAYLALWRLHYSLPPRETIPDWREMLARSRRERHLMAKAGRPRKREKLVAILMAPVAVLGLLLLFLRRKRKKYRQRTE